MKIKALIITSALCCAATASAQRVVEGEILDQDSRPLMGAKISVKGDRSLKAVSNDQGKYSLSIPHNQNITLQVSYLGFQGEQIELKQTDTKHTFYLKEDNTDLNEVVVTGTRTPRVLKDAPILTRVISSEDIAKSDATNIGDLLQTELPGIEFSFAMDQQTSLNMQGFGGNAVLFLVDGERVAGETLDNIDYSRLSLDNVERIEIVKGAASSLYGSNAVGGVVNLISKKADKPWTLNLNAKAGAHEEQRYGAAVGSKTKHTNNMLNVQYNQFGSYLLKGETPENDVRCMGSKVWNFKDRFVYKPIEDLELTAKAGYFFRERDNSEMKKDRYRGFNAGLRGNYAFTQASNLELSYAFDQYDKSDYSPVSDLDVRDYSNVQHITRTLYNQTFDGKHYLTIGADYMRDYLMSYQFTDGAHKQHTADAFAQFDWNPTKSFNVIAGLRYDYFSAAEMQHVSPKLGVMYKFNHGSVRASYASGFRAPTLKEMYMNFDMASIFWIYGNPDLKAESSNNLLLTGEYNLGRYNFTLSGFYNLVNNRITTAWNQALDGMKYTNMAKLRIGGVDANASVKYPCGFGARISYVYTHEHIKKGEPLTSSTRPHTATARFEYDKRWKNYGFNLSLTGRVLSDVTVDEYTQSNSYEETERVHYPGYTIWKLHLNQHIWRGINLSLIVDNLFNYQPKNYEYNSPTSTGTTFSAGLCINVDQLF